MKKESQLFKIWDTKNNQYISGNGKTHWKSMKWVLSKLRDLCNNRGWQGKRDPDEFEIRIFELQLVDTISAKPLFEKDEHQRKNQLMNKELVDICKKKILKLFPNIAVQQTINLYKDGLLNTESMILLKPIIIQLVEAERNS